MKRYYNLKKGSPEVMGHVIEVDTKASLEKRVNILTSSNENFMLLSYQGDKALYEIISDGSDRYVGVGISVRHDGYAEICNSPKKGIFYFNEISAKKAKKLLDGY